MIHIFTFRGPQLKQHFAQNEKNLSLPQKDRLYFISNPEYIWWKIDQKKTNFRYISDFKSPVEFIQSLFHFDIISHICNYTEPVKFNGKIQKLTPTDIYKFIGTELIRGYLGIRNIKYLWSTEKFTINFPGKASQLSENQWFAISNGLDYDIEFVHKSLIELYQHHLVPGYNVTVDEIRIPCTHESCPFKNHNRDKPDIWAIESKSLHADNGYLLDFINPCQENIPTPRESIFHFSTYLQSTTRRHHVVADSNFLGALDLLELWDRGLEATISCKSNRASFIWRDGLVSKLPRGYTRVASSERLCCIATHNKGKPKIATTLCRAVESDGPFVIEERRDVLKIYDEYKGKADQFGRLYKAQYPNGTHKNWKNVLLIGWFYFTLTNAYILYSMRFNDLTHEEFVFKIAKSFLLK